jgi:beta-glucosidase
VAFRVAADQLAFTGVDGRLRLEPGTVEVAVGTSSADLPWRGTFELTGEVVVPFERSRYFAEVRIT